MPTNSATAGIAATASIQRQTCGSWISWSRTAFMMNASIWPVTIISSLMVTIRPRRCAGAISARNSGQVAAAAPTPSPRTIARDHHDRDVRRDGAAQRADQEQPGADQQAALAAERVGQLAAEQRAEGGAGEQQRR